MGFGKRGDGMRLERQRGREWMGLLRRGSGQLLANMQRAHGTKVSLHPYNCERHASGLLPCTQSHSARNRKT